MTDLFVPLPYTFEPEPPPAPPRGIPIRIAPAASDDRRFILRTWVESFHLAPGNWRESWKRWRPEAEAMISRLLDAASTRTLCAYNDAGRVIGWIAWTPGRGISTVHYVYVRHHLDEFEWRRRGVMAALIDAAGLGTRIAYTHKGEIKIGSKWKRQLRKRPTDEDVVEWLAGRGVTAVYEEIGRWLA